MWLESITIHFGNTLRAHFDKCEEEFPSEVAELRKSLNVDGVVLGAESVNKVKHLKDSAINIFQKATSTLHKWHSSRPVLESAKATEDAVDQSFAKEQLETKGKDVRR